MLRHASLPHWIAYWAIGKKVVEAERCCANSFAGWHMSLQRYKTGLQEVIGKMFAILPFIKRENRAPVNMYLDVTYQWTASIYESIQPCQISHALETKFETYVDAEEKRIRSYLESIDYDIDAQDTVSLITGHGRIERVRYHFSVKIYSNSQTVSLSFPYCT